MMLGRYRGILVVLGAATLVSVGSLLQLFRVPDGWLDDLEDPAERALWRGYRSQLRGDHVSTQRHWEEAGPSGQALAARLTTGIRIRDALASQRLEDRQRALLDWEAWQGSDPGMQVWRDAGHAVTAHAGTRTVVSIARGEYDELFRATPETPLRLAVYGPARLRLAVRPLHEDAGGEPIDDWIGIGSADGLRRHPVIDNGVSPGLRPATDEPWRPGQEIEIVQPVPAGYHEFTVGAAGHDLLVGVAVAEPRRPLTVLPRLSPYTVRHALAAAGRVAPSARTVAVTVVDHCRAMPALAAAEPAPEPLAAPSAAWFEDLEAQRGQRLPPTAEPAAAISARERLAALLWAAEQEPERHAALLAEAEQLAESGLPVAGADATLRRLRRPASWELLRTVQESAGLRLIEFTGWQPEAPELQIRKAMMGLEAADEQVMSGHDARALSLYNLEPVVVGLRLSLVEAAMQPMRPMRVLLRWDDRKQREVVLDGDTPVRYLEQRVGTGYHVLRVRIVEPLANQFLRIRLEERRGTSRRLIAEPVQRSYMLATREQPLVVMARGPTRLRVDEWRDGRTLVSYRTVPEGWQRVEVAVEKGRDEALLRVFKRTLEPGRPTAALRETSYRPEPLEAAQWPQLPTIDRADAPLAALPSGRWPGSSTWSLNSGYTSRREVDNEPQSAGAAERFAALGASYQSFSADQDTYRQADGAVRLRENGDPTLALGGLASVRAPGWPVNLDVSGSLFLQHVAASGGIESATTLRARASRQYELGEKLSHRPALTLFQRWLSLEALPRESTEEVDRDVFTRYKRDHGRGLRAGDRIQYQPWLDTVLFAGAELISNEDLNLFAPDHLSLSLGARQLVGDLDLELRYMRYEYFADDDRRRGNDAQRLRLDAVFGRWLGPRRGLRASATLDYDFDSNDVSLYLSLSLDLAEGRYYRDFAPGDVDFRPLRQRRMLERHVGEGWQ